MRKTFILHREGTSYLAGEGNFLAKPNFGQPHIGLYDRYQSGGQMTKKNALITGITGQDGSYLSELLLEKGYDVHGLVRRTSSLNRSRIDETRRLARKRGQIFELHYGDLGDSSSLNKIIAETNPYEIYNLAAQSHVQVSFASPEHACQVNAQGVLHLLEAIKTRKLDCKFYQASTSELFGEVAEIPQNEKTPFHPRSPYAVAKLYGHWIVRNYREAFSMHASNGILFNHESPRRGENFVTRKITLSLARIKYGLQDTMCLGNIDAKRDWGFAGDFVQAMWLMLQQPEPDDYVISTGETRTVREFIMEAAPFAGFDLAWEGDGIDEIARDQKTGKIVVKIDPKYYRPAEVDLLVGDASYAREKLGWVPTYSFKQLVEAMIVSDLNLAKSAQIYTHG